MTDDEIKEIASSYMEMDADMYVSFLPSNLDKFARAIEKASRRAALEEAANIARLYDLGTPDGHAISDSIRAISGPTET